MRGRGKPGTGPSSILSELLSESDPPDVRLFSLLHRIAPLTGKVDHFMGFTSSCCQHQKTLIASSLLAELSDLETELTAWLSTLQTTSSLHWEENSALWLSCLTLPPISETFATAVVFPSIRVAISMLLYWTGLLFINILRDTLDDAILLGAFSMSSVDSLSPLERESLHATNSTSFDLAVRIARSFEYFLQPEMNHLGTYLIGFAMGVVRTYFETRQMYEELDWIKVIDAKITAIGSGLSGFLEELRERNLSMMKSASVTPSGVGARYPPLDV